MENTPTNDSEAGISIRRGLHFNNSLTQKVILAVIGLLTMFQGLQVWVSSIVLAWNNTIAVIGIASGLSIMLLAFYFRSERRIQALERFACLIFVILFSTWVYTQIQQNPGYGTDEISFDQYAAELLIEGKDPFIYSMAPSLDKFHVPAIYHTYTVEGKEVNQQSYPALSFLMYAPILLLGLKAQAATYVDSFFWMITVLLLYGVLPRPYKMIALLLGMAIQYQSYVVGGVTDVLFMPFLVFGAYKWDRYQKQGETSFVRWIGPIAMGLAAGIKQTTWFLMPFVFLAIYLEHRDSRNAKKIVFLYIGIFLAAFLIPNLPFILWHPANWFTGILAPFLHPTIPSGQGLINLTIFGHMGGGNLAFYTAAGAALIISFLILETIHYKKMKPILFILPSIIFFFPTRSFGSYLIDLFIGFLVSYLTITHRNEEEHNITKRWYKRRFVCWILLFPTALFTWLALFYPAPLTLTVKDIHTTGQLGTVDSLKMEVTNTSGHSVNPHFTITSYYLTTFWNVLQGPNEIKPNETVEYELAAPNEGSMPSISGGFYVDAFTSHPTALSTSVKFESNELHTRITPEAVNEIVPINTMVTLKVSVLDKIGRPIEKGGMTVTLGQAIYDQTKLLVGESSINGNEIGKSPVVAITNEQGVATFTIQTDMRQKNPIFYQAFLKHQKGYPYGYSQIVTIRFK